MTFREKIKKFRKHKVGGIVWNLMTSVIMLLAAAFVGIFIAVGEVKGGPEVFAEKYFSYFSAGNWYNMYNDTEIVESDFVNRTTFNKFMASHMLTEEVDEYEVEITDRDGDIAVAEITYNNGKKHTMKLKQQEEKIMLFYTTWQGTVDDFIVENYVIKVPDSIEIKFDGQDMSKYAQKDETTGMVTYTIDRIFMGTYTLSLSGKVIEDTTKELVIDKSNLEYVVTTEEFEMRADHKKNVSDKALELLVAYYTSALTGTGSDDLKALVANDESVRTAVEERYQSLADAIEMPDGRTLINIEISDYDCIVENYKYMESVEVTVNYTTNYEARYPGNIISGVKKNYLGTNSASMKVYYQYREGAWVVTGTDMVCVDYTVVGNAE